jgi:hypothetical protein
MKLIILQWFMKKLKLVIALIAFVLISIVALQNIEQLVS